MCVVSVSTVSKIFSHGVMSSSSSSHTRILFLSVALFFSSSSLLHAFPPLYLSTSSGTKKNGHDIQYSSNVVMIALPLHVDRTVPDAGVGSLPKGGQHYCTVVLPPLAVAIFYSSATEGKRKREQARSVSWRVSLSFSLFLSL